MHNGQGQASMRSYPAASKKDTIELTTSPDSCDALQLRQLKRQNTNWPKPSTAVKVAWAPRLRTTIGAYTSWDEKESTLLRPDLFTHPASKGYFFVLVVDDNFETREYKQTALVSSAALRLHSIACLVLFSSI